MFDHVTIRVADGAASERFYRTTLGALGIEPTSEEEFLEWDDFSFSPATADRPTTTGLHVAFVAPSREHVDAFWRAGVDAGFRSDGEPGPRPVYRDDYYGAFLLDPDGNSVEAVHHGALRRDGNVDHLWIRVADVAASRAFYDVVAPIAGFEGHVRAAQGAALPHRVLFTGGNGSFSVVAGGEPTRDLHLAFPAPNNGVVDEFHRAMTAAGYEDNGAPGERPIYHEGYYGAFVLDPAGHNIELVCHNRPSSCAAGPTLRDDGRREDGRSGR